MTLRIGINGFGRIGRNVLRAAWHLDDVEIVHINDLTSDEMLAYLLRRDTVHGTWGTDIRAVDGGLSIEGKVVSTSSERDPEHLPWAEKGVDVVLECTGAFTSGPKARAHLTAGAKKVIISAPGTDVDGTFVVGVNDDQLDPSTHHIVSNASCTTNCLAPPAKVLHESVGIVKGLMTTIHAYTMDQNLLDAPHRGGKFRRARAAAQNMVPTSTGAAKAIGLVLPELAGKLNGMAIRVPTPNVSVVDLVFTASRDTSVQELNDALIAAANGPLQGVLATTDEPVVSSDLIGNSASSIVDLSLTQVSGGNLVKIITWYDNEWGFSCRMLDLARKIMGA
ncbi:MAG: type I glyceraldehyde-3-phosphate dehydrogenase [Deltaproteobacteria bacterium]|nr:MAG: type I glyceraldehyde-3-phosphate dehydrogenase [Deltaproteobacteria bacterium]